MQVAALRDIDSSGEWRSCLAKPTVGSGSSTRYEATIGATTFVRSSWIASSRTLSESIDS